MKISIKAARVNAELTQAEAAKKLGVSLSALASWERGSHKPTWRHVEAMAELYGWPVDGLRL